MEGTDTEGGHIYTDIGDKYRIVQFFQGACNAELHVPLFQSFFCFKVAKKEMQNRPVAWNELRTGRNTTLIISHSILKRYTRRKALLVDCYQEKNTETKCHVYTQMLKIFKATRGRHVKSQVVVVGCLNNTVANWNYSKYPETQYSNTQNLQSHKMRQSQNEAGTKAGE